MSETKPYPTRKIGNTDVTALGYGAMAIGNLAYGYAGTDEERFKVLDRLFELGCTNWDTAYVYGDSEELIGKWFARTGNRSKIFLATKFGIDRAPIFMANKDGFTDDRTPPISATGPGGVRGDPEFLRETFATSLKRLQTDYVDLLYQHRTDAKVPIEVTVKAMKELVDEGKVKYLGLSEASPNTVRRAYKVHPISALQMEYSPWELGLEKPGGVIEVARELGIAIVAYSPTGRGLVTGRWRSFDDLPEGDFRRTVPKYQPKNWPRINKLIDAFQSIASKYSATPAQLTIAWLLKQGDDIIPIPGSKQLKYVEENLGALELYERLEEGDLKEIRKLADEVSQDLGADSRYPNMGVIQIETPPLQE